MHCTRNDVASKYSNQWSKREQSRGLFHPAVQPSGRSLGRPKQEERDRPIQDCTAKERA